MSLPRLAGPRLLLVPVTPPVAAAVVTGGDVAAALAPLGLRAGPGWPHAGTTDALRPYAEHPAVLAPGQDPPVWLVVDGVRVIGEAGLTGAVDGQGDQEIGYGVAAPSRGQGVGTEAVALLCAWAERQPGVRRVVAEVLVGNEPSQRLLSRLSFKRTAGVPPYERWVRPAVPEPAPARRIAGRHVC